MKIFKCEDYILKQLSPGGVLEDDELADEVDCYDFTFVEPNVSSGDKLIYQK
jgi:hypothetical protein